MKPDFVQALANPVFVEVKKDAEGIYYTDFGGVRVNCVGETDIVPPEKIAPEVLCYYGQFNAGLDEATGEPELVPPPKVWWLQQRQPHNVWQAFNLEDPNDATPVVVTGVDTGDLLESSIIISAKQIRTEFTMLKNAAGDVDFGQYVLDPFVSTLDLTKFQAYGMSGAVPGTDQSIAETQGADYGPGPAGELGGTLAMVDPATIKVAKNYFDPDAVAIEAEEPGDPRIVVLDEPIGMHATVYSGCARLIIQKVGGNAANLYWDSVEGNWMPRADVNNPVVDLHAWDGSYSAEINAGGSVIYGYNWNTKNFSEGAGVYRMTFLLEGDASAGGSCPYTLNTVFDDTSMSVNVGERRPATMIPGTDAAFTHGEGGLVYVDIEIAGGGGGGGGGKK